MSDDKNRSEATNSPEESKGTPEPDYAGYKSLDEMRAAIYASRKEGKRLAEEHAVMQAQLAALTRPAAAERSAIEEINDLGLPADTFKRALREQIEAELAPMLKANEAVVNVRRTNPEFSKFEGDFQNWLADNPQAATQYQKTVARAPEAAELALEGIFAQFARSKRAEVEKAEPGERKVSPDAQISSGGGGSAPRKSTEKRATPEQVQELIKHARRNNDPVPLMRAILGNTPIHRDIERMKGQNG